MISKNEIAPLIILNGVMLTSSQTIAVMSAITRYTSVLGGSYQLAFSGGVYWDFVHSHNF